MAIASVPSTVGVLGVVATVKITAKQAIEERAHQRQLALDEQAHQLSQHRRRARWRKRCGLGLSQTHRMVELQHRHGVELLGP